MSLACRWVFLVLLVSVLVSLTYGEGAMDLSTLSASPSPSPIDCPELLDSNLQYEFYKDMCPDAEKIVRQAMTRFVVQNNKATAQILRLCFHDCFIQGCDASILLEVSGTNNQSVEKLAAPNHTLKGFNFIDSIKEELEKKCPGVVSCADILVLATRDAIALAGGPFYPLLTGRRDSNTSYHDQALAEIPRPEDNISETLRLFSLRGFSERETVSLLGGHNIGEMGCKVIHNRIQNFQGTGKPDPSMPSDFFSDLSRVCRGKNDDNSSVSSGAVFGSGTQYYQRLLNGRGLLFADQQLMADEKIAELVRAYASDDGTAFRIDFARAMSKMSNLDILTGSQGHVRLNCSIPVN